MPIPEEVRGTLPWEDLATDGVKEVEWSIPWEDSTTTGDKEVGLGHPEDGSGEVVGGASMASTLSSLDRIVGESLRLRALNWDSKALATTEGPPMEGPGHGHFTMTFFGCLP